MVNRTGHQRVSFESLKQAINSHYITINFTLIHLLTAQATWGRQGSHIVYKDQCPTEELHQKTKYPKHHRASLPASNVRWLVQAPVR